jgi:folate-dependent phosphoribosylglycinamide formyltransferase PurN
LLEIQEIDGTVSATRTDILLLGGDNPTTWIVYNALVQHFGPMKALIEPRVAKSTMFRTRVRKLGLLTVLSQIAFVMLIRPFLRRAGEGRINEICQRFGLETTAPLTHDIMAVDSANEASCLAILKQIAPKVIVVNGTRILKPATLASTDAVFINTHQGITPGYRGAHGAYWALHENDPAHCGVTVHIVDQGIDTGNIVGQAIIEPGTRDSFVTYPYLQTAAALPLLTQAIENTLKNSLVSQPVNGKSGVWYHPGFFQYLRGRMRGVK